MVNNDREIITCKCRFPKLQGKKISQYLPGKFNCRQEDVKALSQGKNRKT